MPVRMVGANERRLSNGSVRPRRVRAFSQAGAALVRLAATVTRADECVFHVLGLPPSWVEYRAGEHDHTFSPQPRAWGAINCREAQLH